MRHLLFDSMGDEYPAALQQKYPHVFHKIMAHWKKPDIGDYFTSLLIDTRGGRKGFDDDAFKDIHRLYKFHEMEVLREVEDKLEARRELELLGINFHPSAFLKAVIDGTPRLVDLFVRGGINVNTRDDNGNTCLQIALKSGFTVIANILLKAGADADVKDDLGLTPLLESCGKRTRGHQELAEQLIRLGADVNVRDPMGWTPLMLAISVGNADLVELLLDYGANPTLRTRKGDNAIDMARKFGYEEFINLLIEYSNQKSDFSS